MRYCLNNAVDRIVVNYMILATTGMGFHCPEEGRKRYTSGHITIRIPLEGPRASSCHTYHVYYY